MLQWWESRWQEKSKMKLFFDKTKISRRKKFLSGLPQNKTKLKSIHEWKEENSYDLLLH